MALHSGMRARFLALGIVGTLLLSARPAEADAFDDLGAALIVVAAVPAVGLDTMFTVYDAAVNGCEELPSTGWAVAETLVVAPQTIALNYATAVIAADSDTDRLGPGLLLLPTAWATALSTHGMWAWASDDVHHDALYGVPWIIGANIAVTNAMVAQTMGASGSSAAPLSLDTSATSMVMMTPAIINSAYQWATSDSAKAGWGALTIWSSALFAYGLISLPVGVAEFRGSGPPRRRFATPLAPPFTLSPIATSANGPAPGITALGAW